MRKLFALILLVPVATLFMGSVRLSSLCGIAVCGISGSESALGGSCGKAVFHGTCQKMGCCGSCAKANGQAKGCGKAKGVCHKGKDQSKGKETGSGSCCMDCPLCTLVTVKPFIRFEWVGGVSSVEYAVRSDNNLKDYFQKHWKPPAGVVFS